MNTLIGKLKDLDFFVFVYQLESPRFYGEGFAEQTVGIGFVGEDEDEMETGKKQLLDTARWLRSQVPMLQEQYGKEFPDRAQYEAFGHMEKDYSLLISGETRGEIEGMAWIQKHLLCQEGTIEDRIMAIEQLPVKVEYRRI